MTVLLLCFRDQWSACLVFRDAKTIFTPDAIFLTYRSNIRCAIV